MRSNKAQDELMDLITNAIKLSSRPYHELATSAGITRRTIQRWMSGDTLAARSNTICRVAKVLLLEFRTIRKG